MSLANNTLFKVVLPSICFYIWSILWKHFIEAFHLSIFSSNPPVLFSGKGVLSKCSKFAREHPCQSVILIKLPCTSVLVLSCWLLLYFYKKMNSSVIGFYWKLKGTCSSEFFWKADSAEVYKWTCNLNWPYKRRLHNIENDYLA